MEECAADLMPNSVYRETQPGPEYQPILHSLCDEEVLLYDPIMDRVNLLNPQAAKVYANCDGKTSKAEVAAGLGEQGEELLELSLEQLREARLINLPEVGELRRRELLQVLGKAAVVLPLVSSVLMPQPVAAQSSGCETGGTAGCTSAGLFGGINGDPTGACMPCCGTGATAACTSCPGDCANDCFCMRRYICTNNGVTPVLCSTAMNGSICVGGTTDQPSNVICVDDGFNSTFRKSCAAARAATTGSFYSCCECP